MMTLEQFGVLMSWCRTRRGRAQTLALLMLGTRLTRIGYLMCCVHLGRSLIEVGTSS